MLEESKWVKDMSTRMRVFNGQIFDSIFTKHCKDNKEMHYTYLTKNYNKLMTKAYYDGTVSIREYFDFCDQYEANLNRLKKKELTDKKAFPPMVK